MLISASSSSSSSSSPTGFSNLERFLQSVTPVLPSKTSSKLSKEKIEYFMLRDLWDCYDEWSAYGIGLPVLLKSGETVLQYFVPHLSAIQIYNKPVVASRNRREHIAVLEIDSWSDETESTDNLSRSPSNNSSKTWDLSEDSGLEQDSSLPVKDKLGQLYLQYNETCSPYWRTPLADKVTELAQQYPALMTLKSMDVCPASWMAVSWYPIYHIPCCKNDEDLSTGFLTYHTLSSAFQDYVAVNDGTMFDKDICSSVTTEGRIVGRELKDGKSRRICLSPFGLATYKMQGDLWAKPETPDHENMVDLYYAADSWLKQLSFEHHDFNFFSWRTNLTL